MTDMNRREATQLLALGSLAAAFEWTPAEAGRAAERLTAARAGGVFEPKFFTAHEYETVKALADMVIPKDDRSGSASDAQVPEFMDFVMTDGSDERRIAMRGGLAWLDIQCRRRYGGKTFVECVEVERKGVVDDIAWPARAKPEMSQGAAFFTSFRDLTASGFFSTKLGVEDLRYIGNTFVPQWNGCPPEALAKLGVRYP
jgi:gluconate 2-dehydrogenase subunit 3-like protein